MTTNNPLPPFFDQANVGKVWKVEYQKRAQDAKQFAKENKILPAAKDQMRVALMIIDAQNTFCIPDFELFVAGQSGQGAVEDNIRLCEFIYKNMGSLTQIFATMDTHRSYQIFHPAFWVNEKGENPEPFTQISETEVIKGNWKVSPTAASVMHGNYMFLQRHALHYVKRLSEGGRYNLTIWPYHAMLGGIGHALVAAVEEACFTHSIARGILTGYEIKGGNPLSENYSVLRQEVLDGPEDPDTKLSVTIGQRNTEFIKKLMSFDKVVIAGQAKSHCVAWTIEDLLTEIASKDITLAKKVYLLEDCTSPVVIPGVIDYTDEANKAFERFSNAGMHVIKSTDPVSSWIHEVN